LTQQTWSGVLDDVRTAAQKAGVFGAITLEEGMLVCEAKESAEPAQYRVRVDGGELWVELVTENRWLSESIESDLMHTGDKIEELIDEELVDLGCDDGPLAVEHFRSEDMLFTFRSKAPVSGDARDAEIVSACLLAYEACFRQLGDMEGGEED